MSKNISTTPPVSCTLCPRRCGANRAAGQTGFCGAGSTLKAARAALHFWDAVIVLYAFILGFFVYKELKLSYLPRIFKETMMTTGIVMFIVAAANAFSYVLTICKLGNVLTDMAAAMPNAITFIIVVNVLLLILGMFMESTAILIVITPVLVPVAQAMGIDLVYFGVMMVLNLMIGLATPPFGMGLFTVSQVAKLPVEKTVKAILPFIPVLLVVLLMIIFMPALVTWLPSIVM